MKKLIETIKRADRKTMKEMRDNAISMGQLEGYEEWLKHSGKTRRLIKASVIFLWYIVFPLSFIVLFGCIVKLIWNA